MNFSDKTLHLTYDEFYVLMCLLGASTVQGTFVESYYDISPDNLESMWDKCKKSLSAKEYMILDSDNVQLDVGLYCILNECIKAERTYSIQFSKDKNKITDTLFYDRIKSLICVSNCAEKGEVYLSYANKKNAYESIMKEMRTASESQLEAISFETTLSQQEYFTLLSNANMGDYTKVVQLFPEDAPEEYITDLVNALKNSYGLFAVNEFEREDIVNYNILLGETFFWAIDAREENAISFRLVSAQEVAEAVAQTFRYDRGGE